MTIKPADARAWGDLAHHADAMKTTTLDALFAADPGRDERFTYRVEGMTLDLTRAHITDETVQLWAALAKERGFEARRDAMVAGEKINVTEGRAVLHTALRAPDDAVIAVDGADVMPDVRALRARMRGFVEAVRSGAWTGATGQPIRDIVNIGIGGSDLGPRLVAEALRRPGDSGPRAHFVANVDAADILGVLEGLNPATTLCVVVSKTFTTQETLMNAMTARAWLVAALGEDALPRHVVAVSTNREAVAAFGVGAANMFPMWDWVGGRYSLWSSVGLSAALALGWMAFQSLLDGAAAMDRHVRTAPMTRNLPVLLAMTGLWYRNFRGSAAHAILPYAERLRSMPRYLQQLEMESNGKSVTCAGEAVGVPTAPVIFGECGTVGQHSFHQWLHQGTDVIPADFIGVRQDDLGHAEHHRALNANMVAQAEALKSGRAADDPARVNPGNRPSTLIWLDRMDARHLGMLLALYEHKVFAQGVMWGINSFDQFGVELGKKLAAEVMAA